MMRRSIGLVAILLTACSSDPGSSPEEEKRVEYWEKVESGYIHVRMYPLDDCRLRVAHSAHLDLVRLVEAESCNSDELKSSDKLLDHDRWNEYRRASSVDKIPIDPEAQSPPPEDLPPDSPGWTPSTNDYVEGTVKVSRFYPWGEREPPETVKYFNVDEAGEEEMELIEFFRGLYDKYGEEKP